MMVGKGFLSVKDYLSEVPWLNLIVGEWVIVHYQSHTLNGKFGKEGKEIFSHHPWGEESR